MSKTYFEDSGVLAVGWATAQAENELQATQGAGSNSNNVAASASDAEHFAYTTLSGEPDSANWPNGTYEATGDVSSTGADVTWRWRFNRVTSDAVTLEQSTFQSQANFSGTGLHQGTATWDPTAGSAGDRYGIIVLASNASMHSAQTLSFQYNASTDTSGPWTSGPTGSGTASLPAVAAAGAGDVDVAGSGTASLAAVQAAGAGDVDVAGSGTGSLPAVQASGAGTTGGPRVLVIGPIGI